MLRLVDLALDCDGDALLVTRRAGRPDLPPRHAVLLRPRRRAGRARAAGLRVARDALGDDRRRGPPNGRRAPTRRRCSTAAWTPSRRKVTEEATEVLIAAKDDAAAERPARIGATREALAGEMADLLYHALVLLAERGLAPAAVIETLRARHQKEPDRSSAPFSLTLRPTSRRRFPIRMSSHSPAIGSGTNAGSVTRAPFTVTPPSGDPSAAPRHATGTTPVVGEDGSGRPAASARSAGT